MILRKPCNNNLRFCLLFKGPAQGGRGINNGPQLGAAAVAVGQPRGPSFPPPNKYPAPMRAPSQAMPPQTGPQPQKSGELN